MNTNYHLDTAYIAGLFDGEGSLTYAKYKEKKKSGTYDCRRISMEISMTDKNVIELVHETLMVGTVRPKKVPTGMKPQWRWRCTFRDCLQVCKKLWPYVTVKLHAIEKVIDHYEPDIQDLDDNVVDLSIERKKKSMTKPLPEYDIVKEILIKHDCLNSSIEDLDDPILMQDLFDHFVEDMPYGTQKARDGDPDEYIYDKLEDLKLPLGNHND